MQWCKQIGRSRHPFQIWALGGTHWTHRTHCAQQKLLPPPTPLTTWLMRLPFSYALSYHLWNLSTPYNMDPSGNHFSALTYSDPAGS